jgi:hypothetical protein
MDRSSMSDIASINAPYPTQGRRESQNVERPVYGSLDMLAKGATNAVNAAHYRSGNIVPGGVQGPLPQRGPGLNDPQRVTAIADMYDLAGIPVPQRAAQVRASERLADQIAPGGDAAGQFNAMADQSAAGIRQGIASNLEGQFLGVRDLNENQRMAEAAYQSALGQPMQGGNWSGVDRERRLDMLSPENNSAQQYAQRRASTGEGKRDAIVNALMQQGVSLDELVDAEQRDGRHGLASLLNPGTVLRGMGEGGVPFTVVRGPGEPETTPERLQAIEARQGRNVEARRERIQSRRDAFAKRQENQERTMAMMMDPMNDPRIRSNPDAMGALMQGRNAANMGQLERDRFGMEQQAFQYAMSPEGQAAERMASARSILSQMSPEMMSTPLGRQLQQEAMGGQQGGPVSQAVQPTIPEAAREVSRLVPDVQTILGQNPVGMTPTQILKTIDDRAAAGTPIQDSDMQTLMEFIRNMSIADPTYIKQAELTARSAIGSDSYTPGTATQSANRAASEARTSRWSSFPGAPR